MWVRSAHSIGGVTAGGVFGAARPRLSGPGAARPVDRECARVTRPVSTVGFGAVERCVGGTDDRVEHLIETARFAGSNACGGQRRVTGCSGSYVECHRSDADSDRAVGPDSIEYLLREFVTVSVRGEDQELFATGSRDDCFGFADLCVYSASQGVGDCRKRSVPGRVPAVSLTVLK